MAANSGFGKGSFTISHYGPRMQMVVLLFGILALAGCDAPVGVIAAPVTAGIAVGSITTIGRSPVDAVYSLATGRDCSIVRLDQGKTYCRPTEPPPGLPEFCSRSLGVPNCWLDPASLADHPESIADGPTLLTPQQEANRTRAWP